MLEAYNKEYLENIEEAMIKAILEVGRKYGEGNSVLLSGEIVSASLSVIAFAASTSRVTETPKGIRKFSEWCASRIRARIKLMQGELQAGPIPDFHIVHADERH